ncbi:MAG: hypothetical protein ACREPV_07940 [Lysobacter sp.]
MGKILVSLVLALSCAGVASAAEQAPADKAADAATYKPKTKHDNTPYRFNMEQDGKRMTADQFDAWMKSKGVRVATGKPAAAAEPEAKKAK